MIDRRDYILTLLEEGYTLAEIGESLKISRQRVHQLIQKYGVQSVFELRVAKKNIDWEVCLKCGLVYMKGTYRDHIYSDEHTEQVISEKRAQYKDIIYDYYNADMTIEQIAKKHKLAHPSHIYRYLHKANLPVSTDRASDSQRRRRGL